MSIVQAALHEADKPEHHGNGYLFKIRTKTGNDYRGGLFSTEESVCKTGVVHMDLWPLDPHGGVENGPVGRQIFIAEDAIESIEIEW